MRSYELVLERYFEFQRHLHGKVSSHTQDGAHCSRSFRRVADGA